MKELGFCSRVLLLCLQEKAREFGDADAAVVEFEAVILQDVESDRALLTERRLKLSAIAFCCELDLIDIEKGCNDDEHDQDHKDDIDQRREVDLGLLRLGSKKFFSHETLRYCSSIEATISEEKPSIWFLNLSILFLR